MIERLLNLLPIIESGASIFLFGGRGTGKSSLINFITSDFPHKIVFDFLESSQYTRYLVNPSLVKQEIEHALTQSGANRLLVFIDEIQKIPPVLDDVHLLIERHKERIQFILSGSSARKLKAQGVNLLGGRALVFHLYPFLARELQGQFSLPEALRFGSLPLLYGRSDEIKKLTLQSYTETYLREEIKHEALTRNLHAFSTFLDLAAQLNGELVNYSKLARICHVSINTIITYYQILFDTLIAFELPAWERSVKKQLLKAPRVYFFDCGVLNTIRKELGIEITANSLRSGKLFESFLINEIFRHNHYARQDYSLYHWHAKNDEEVDVILCKNRFSPPLAIEIKMGSEIFDDDLKGLRAFKEEEKEARLFCFCNTPKAYFRDNVEILPWQDGLTRL